MEVGSRRASNASVVEVRDGAEDADVEEEVMVHTHAHTHTHTHTHTFFLALVMHCMLLRRLREKACSGFKHAGTCALHAHTHIKIYMY